MLRHGRGGGLPPTRCSGAGPRWPSRALNDSNSNSSKSNDGRGWCGTFSLSRRRPKCCPHASLLNVSPLADERGVSITPSLGTEGLGRRPTVTQPGLGPGVQLQGGSVLLAPLQIKCVGHRERKRFPLAKIKGIHGPEAHLSEGPPTQDRAPGRGREQGSACCAHWEAEGDVRAPGAGSGDTRGSCPGPPQSRGCGSWVGLPSSRARHGGRRRPRGSRDALGALGVAALASCYNAQRRV